MNTFDLLNLSLLPDLETAEVYEFKIQHGGIKTPAFCTKCKMNWADLHSQTEAADEYCFCPLCRTDLYLADFKKDEESFLCSPVDSSIVCVETGATRLYHHPVTESNYKPSVYLTEYEVYLIELERFKKEDIAIAEYVKVFHEQGKAAAEAAFFNMLKLQS